MKKEAITKIILSILAVLLCIFAIYYNFASKLVVIGYKYPGETGKYADAYYKNKWYVYDNDFRIEDADVKTFIHLGGVFGKDKNHVFYNSAIVYMIDPNDVKEIIFNKYIKTSDGLYSYNSDYGSKKIEEVDIDSFQIFYDIYAIDKNHVYYNNYGRLEIIERILPKEHGNVQTIEKISPEGFKYLTEDFFINKYGLYSHYSHASFVKINEIDIVSLEKIGGKYIKDKNGIYFLDEYIRPIKNIDVNSVKYIGGNYIKDKDHVYFNGEKIKYADPDSFELLANDIHEIIKKHAKENGYSIRYSSTGDTYAKDKSYVYKDGEIIEREDPDFFEFNIEDHLSDFTETPKDKFFNALRDRIKRNSISITDKIKYSDWYKEYSQNKLNKSQKQFTRKIDEEEIKEWEESWYHFYNDSIYYDDSLVGGVDMDSFETIDRGYAKDKLFVYYHDFQIWGADPNSFEILGYGYSKDINHIYYRGWKLENVDYDSFEYLNNICARDKSKVYCEGKAESKVDRDSFGILNDKYMKDKNHIYLMYANFNKLNNVDYKSFKVLSGPYAMDRYHIYNNGHIINGKLDPLTLSQISDSDTGYKYDKYIKDKNGVYFIYISELGEFKNADPDTFEVISWGLSKDKNHVYSSRCHSDCEPKILDVDAKTFEYLGSGYYKDANSIYYKDEKLKGVDYDSFEELDNDYAKDKNTIYYEGMPISEFIDEDDIELFESMNYITFKGFDPETFKVLPSGNAIDKNNGYITDTHGPQLTTKEDTQLKIPYSYYGSSNISSNFNVEDPNTFEYLSDVIAKDKTSIYILGSYYSHKEINPNNFRVINEVLFADNDKVYYLDYNPSFGPLLNSIRGADPKTFEGLGEYYGRDKDNFYYKWYRIRADIDLETFEFLASGVAKDKKHIYSEGNIIKGADINTLERILNDDEDNIVINSTHYLRDKNGYYCIEDGELKNLFYYKSDERGGNCLSEYRLNLAGFSDSFIKSIIK